MAQREGKSSATSRRSWISALPVVLFAGLAILFYVGLFAGDPKKLPSALIGKPAPTFSLPALDGLNRSGRPVPGLETQALKSGQPVVVNVWASWCGPCRLEHPYLMQLSRMKGVKVVGINYKDVPENARRFLGVHGNPFEAVGVDTKGVTALDWGVYGVPETFVVAGDGRIVLKHVGPITKSALTGKILPATRGASVK